MEKTSILYLFAEDKAFDVRIIVLNEEWTAFACEMAKGYGSLWFYSSIPFKTAFVWKIAEKPAYWLLLKTEREDYFHYILMGSQTV